MTDILPFQIYYSDYDGNISTYNSNDGLALSAPEWGVIAVVTKGIENNWDLHTGDYYLWFENEGTWRASDNTGREDYLANYTGEKKIINGRYISNANYNTVIAQIYNDMPPKSAWFPWEPRPE